jgi:hypothetical protein
MNKWRLALWVFLTVALAVWSHYMNNHQARLLFWASIAGFLMRQALDWRRVAAAGREFAED